MCVCVHTYMHTCIYTYVVCIVCVVAPGYCHISRLKPLLWQLTTQHGVYVCSHPCPTPCPAPCPAPRSSGSTVQSDDSYAGHPRGLLHVERDLVLSTRRADGSRGEAGGWVGGEGLCVCVCVHVCAHLLYVCVSVCGVYVQRWK